MLGQLIVLTGASGSGKTAIARALAVRSAGAYDCLFADDAGIPSAEVMRSYGEGYQPGGAWQRAFTLAWLARVAERLRAGRTVLLEGQMRLAFVYEALSAEAIHDARILLVDCHDVERSRRLIHDRQQADLANQDMRSWAQHFREEAALYGTEILDTSRLTLPQSVAYLSSLLEQRPTSQTALST